MPEHPAIRGDEGDRREMRKIFTATGHRTLNALLIVSGGATVAFMTFLGGAVQQQDLVARISVDATLDFARALKFFFESVLCAVGAHGATYASHAAHHYSARYSDRPTLCRFLNALGHVLMWVTVAVCTLCFVLLMRGGFSAINGFGFVADALTRLPREQLR